MDTNIEDEYIAKGEEILEHNSNISETILDLKAYIGDLEESCTSIQQSAVIVGFMLGVGACGLLIAVGTIFYHILLNPPPM